MGANENGNKSCSQRNHRRNKTHKKNEEWFDEECASYVKEKNNARQKMIKKETRSNYEEYQE
jgi:hypothetical protein